MNIPYWQQQTPAKPLYPDIAWNKPQQRAQAGKLGIIGGNRLSFRAIEHSYTTALTTGVGQARVVLPDALRGTIPASVTDTIFAASNSSGSLGNEAWPELQALTGWADALLLIGDAGRNSQTAIVYEKLVSHTTTPLIISRDAVDLLMPSAPQLASQSNILIIASFSQVQKFLRALYYPKILTFRMPLLQLVETLYKFTHHLSTDPRHLPRRHHPHRSARHCHINTMVAANGPLAGHCANTHCRLHHVESSDTPPGSNS